MTTTAARAETTLLGWGYEGRTIEDLVRDAAAWGIDRVVDVRLNAVSRRKGFSKGALAARLAEAGIDYVHLRALGNPRDNRPGFAHTASVAGRQARDRYRSQVLGSGAGREGVRFLAESGPAIVLCFEAQEQCCHRSLVLEAVRALGSSEEGVSRS